MNIIPGINGSTLIDDTYNSSPDAVDAALNALKGLECVAVSRAQDRRARRHDGARQAFCGRASSGRAGKRLPLPTCCSRSVCARRQPPKRLSKSGMPADRVKSCGTSQEAADYLVPLVKAGDVILVKGSQSIRTERVVKAFCASRTGPMSSWSGRIGNGLSRIERPHITCDPVVMELNTPSPRRSSGARSTMGRCPPRRQRSSCANPKGQCRRNYSIFCHGAQEAIVTGEKRIILRISQTAGTVFGHFGPIV